MLVVQRITTTGAIDTMLPTSRGLVSPEAQQMAEANWAAGHGTRVFNTARPEYALEWDGQQWLIVIETGDGQA